MKNTMKFMMVSIIGLVAMVSVAWAEDGGAESVSAVNTANTAGTQSANSEFTSYDVKSGDTLTKLAKKFYNDSNKWILIRNANKGLITNEHSLKVGMKLRIPNVKSTSPTKSETPQTVLPQTTVFNWKMVTTWPLNFPIFHEGCEKLASDVKLLSNGRLNIEVFAGGQLMPALETFSAVSQGKVEMGHSASYYWSDKVPGSQFFASVPFEMTAKGDNAWLYSGGGLELWRKLYEPFKVVPFPLGNTGVQMGGWFNKEIKTLADFKNLKMRIPGLGGRVLEKAGGKSVLLAAGDIFSSLENHTIDAAEWIGPYHDQRLKLFRVAKYYYYPGWHEPGTTLELIINKVAWDKLPADLQKIIEVASGNINQWMYAQFETLNLKALQELKEEEGVKVLPFPSEVLKELRSLSKEVMVEEAAKHPQFKLVYEAYEKFRIDNENWGSIADDSYQGVLQK